MATELRITFENDEGRDTSLAPPKYLEYLNIADADEASDTTSEGAFEQVDDPLAGLTNRQASGAELIRFPEFRPLQYRPTEFFAAIQEWDGVVRRVEDETIFADLYDVNSSNDTPTQLAEIDFADLDERDRSKVKPGAIFRWLVGRSRTRAGSSSGKWVIYFRPPVASRDSVFEGLTVPETVIKKLDGE